MVYLSLSIVQTVPIGTNVLEVAMPDLLIELPGAQFRRAYLLYVIEICRNQERYFYIGQTGDNSYITARPAFRRLSGHLEDTGQSTQNQVYRYIAVKILGYEEAESKAAFPEKMKQAVEDFLVGSTVRMHIYRAHPFDPFVSRANHLRTVKRVSLLEKFVIKAFVNSGKSLMNRMITPPVEACPYPELLARIESDFGL